MLSLLHGDYLADAGKGLLVLFLEGLSSEEDDQVAWKTEDSKWRMWRSGMVLRGV